MDLEEHSSFVFGMLIGWALGVSLIMFLAWDEHKSFPVLCRLLAKTKYQDPAVVEIASTFQGCLKMIQEKSGD